MTTEPTDTFVYPCLTCGTTIQVRNGKTPDHTCRTLADGESLPAYAWWQGHDHAHRANIEDVLPTVRSEMWRTTLSVPVVTADVDVRDGEQVIISYELLTQLFDQAGFEKISEAPA